MLKVSLGFVVLLVSGYLFGQDATLREEESLFVPVLRAELNLSLEQRQRIEGIETNFQTQNRERIQQMNQLRIQLREALSADPINEQKVFEIQERLEIMQREIVRLRLQADLQIAKVLTSEQRKEWMKRSGPKPERPAPANSPASQGGNKAGSPQPGPKSQPRK
ncbi:MAG: Spy/CpxP family protein refolding chaperone [Brevinematales bacterium]